MIKQLKMKILILGSSGFLGKIIYNKLKNNYKTIHTGLNKRKCSLTDLSNIKKILLQNKPDLIINCVALTNIDTCEKLPKESYNINVNIPKNIFNIKKKYKLFFKFIQFSTDQFYDSKFDFENKESSTIKINNIYTRHKLLAEKICIKNKSLIFRTNFFGKQKTSFSHWVYTRFKNKTKKKFYLFSDVCFSPLRATKIANIIKYIIFNKFYFKYGVYNLGSKQGMSKSNFAILFAKKLNIFNKNKFDIVNSSKIFKTKRSKHMRMNVNKFEKTFKLKLNSLKNEINLGVKEYD
jgi:dTDP-4-dehydrorhamnose reductase